MLTIENNTSFIPPENEFIRILEALNVQNEVELSLVDSQEIQVINRDYRGIDKSTDVLSFPIDPFPHAPLGTIMINIEAVSQEAKNHNHSDKDEACLLFLHGLLHLLGYDHEKDGGEMRDKEAQIVKALGLPPSLIVRTEID